MTLNIDKSWANNAAGRIDDFPGIFRRYAARWCHGNDPITPHCDITTEPWVPRSIDDLPVTNEEIDFHVSPSFLSRHASALS